MESDQTGSNKVYTLEDLRSLEARGNAVSRNESVIALAPIIALLEQLQSAIREVVKPIELDIEQGESNERARKLRHNEDTITRLRVLLSGSGLKTPQDLFRCFLRVCSASKVRINNPIQDEAFEYLPHTEHSLERTVQSGEDSEEVFIIDFAVNEYGIAAQISRKGQLTPISRELLDEQGV